MKKAVRILLAVILFTLANNQMMNGQNLDEHEWENRILIIHSDDENDVLVHTQLDEFIRFPSEMRERKLILYQYRGKQYQIQDFADTKIKTKWKEVESLPKPIREMSPSVEIILIGLDGGVKLRQEKILTRAELFRIIDSMPMRRQEMRRKNRY